MGRWLREDGEVCDAPVPVTLALLLLGFAAGVAVTLAVGMIFGGWLAGGGA